MEILAQTADIDIWRHPITLLVVAAVLSAIGTAVGFALRQIITSQRLQSTAIADLRAEVAVLKGVDQTVARYEADRWRAIEKELAATNAAVGALHQRVDQVMSRLGAGNPEWRP